MLAQPVGDDLDGQVVRQAIQMQLHRVRQLQPAPVVVDALAKMLSRNSTVGEVETLAALEPNRAPELAPFR